MRAVVETFFPSWITDTGTISDALLLIPNTDVPCIVIAGEECGGRGVSFTRLRLENPVLGLTPFVVVTLWPGRLLEVVLRFVLVVLFLMAVQVSHQPGSWLAWVLLVG